MRHKSLSNKLSYAAAALALMAPVTAAATTATVFAAEASTATDVLAQTEGKIEIVDENGKNLGTYYTNATAGKTLTSSDATDTFKVADNAISALNDKGYEITDIAYNGKHLTTQSTLAGTMEKQTWADRENTITVHVGQSASKVKDVAKDKTIKYNAIKYVFTDTDGKTIKTVIDYAQSVTIDGATTEATFKDVDVPSLKGWTADTSTVKGKNVDKNSDEVTTTTVTYKANNSTVADLLKATVADNDMANDSSSSTSDDTSKTSSSDSSKSSSTSDDSSKSSSTSDDSSKSSSTSDDSSKSSSTSDDSSKSSSTSDDSSKTSDDSSKTSDDSSKTSDDSSKTSDDSSKTSDDSSSTSDDASSDDTSDTTDDTSSDDTSDTTDTSTSDDTPSDDTSASDDTSDISNDTVTNDDASDTSDDTSDTTDGPTDTTDNTSDTSDDSTPTDDQGAGTAATDQGSDVGTNDQGAGTAATGQGSDVGTDGPGSGSSKSGKSHKSTTLPQTGEKKSSAGIIGVVMTAAASVLGMFGFKKKEN